MKVYSVISNIFCSKTKRIRMCKNFKMLKKLQALKGYHYAHL